MRLKRSVYNILFGLGSQLVIMALSFVVPRLMMSNYGSEVNGLFSTVNTIYMCLGLVEAGIGTSALQALYKPVVEKDRQTINAILSAARRHYHRCAVVYGAGVAVLSLLAPLVLNTSIGALTIAGVIALQGLASLTNFYVLSGVTVLLSAEGKEYVQNNITMLVTVLTSVVKIVLVNLQVDIVLLQLGYFCVSVLSVMIYVVYFRRVYPWIDLKQKEPPVELKQKGAFGIHSITYVIFSNTDLLLLSTFCDLKVCSVYTVYQMVFSSVLKVINAIFNGLKFNLGHVYNQDRQHYTALHDTYKSVYCAFVFAMFSVCYLLITPFLKLYTRGIEDIVYTDRYLPLLFCLVNLLSSSRSTENNLISLAFHAKQTLPRTIAEAILNLGFSLVLVSRLGIYGCLLGTIIALLYRTNDIVIYANRRILGRAPVQAYLTLAANFMGFGGVMVLERYLHPVLGNYFHFFLWAVALGIPVFLFFCGVNLLANPRGFAMLRSAVAAKWKEWRK